MAHALRRRSSNCKRCAPNEAIWKQRLKDKTHGCAVCHNMSREESWHPNTVASHHATCRDLVCPRCSLRGYAPYRYDSYQCTVCLESFGFGQFLQDEGDFRHFVPHILQRGKRVQNPDLVCKQCRSVLRCSRCGEGYEDAYWTSDQRYHHRRHQTKLVCKPCRTQGFHPRDVVSYTCQSCQGKFGSRKFSTYQITKFRKHNYKTLRCIQCVAEAKQMKATATTSAAAAAKGKTDG